MLQRVKDGGHNADDTITFRGAMHHLKDWRIWAGYVSLQSCLHSDLY